ncbi:MAG: hypothetical protein NTV34_05325, partial [Proteobacteria bacterium]|nr:hypothetical protein [Pseudomonadota bacterium]
MTRSAGPNPMAFSLLSMAPTVLIVMTPLLNLSFLGIAGLSIFGCVTYIVGLMLMQRRLEKIESESAEQERANQVLSEGAKSTGDHGVSFALIQRNSERKFEIVKNDLESRIQLAKIETDAAKVQSLSLSEALGSERKSKFDLTEELIQMRAEGRLRTESGLATGGALNSVVRSLELLVSERDENLLAHENLLRKILDLVPAIQRQLESV